MGRLSIWSRAAIIALNAVPVHSFYLPGVAPHDYSEHSKVQLSVNALTSQENFLPFDFYHPRFHFCQPKDVQAQPESLGSILFGDRIYDSSFELTMLDNKTCNVLCTAKVPSEDVSFINERVMEEYHMNWFVDGLPAAQLAKDRKTGQIFYSMGFPLGFLAKEEDQIVPHLNNHYEINIQYHPVRNSKAFRVVGVIVSPHSVKASNPENNCSPAGATPLTLQEGTENEVKYTYNVHWTSVTERLESKSSIINSMVVVLLLTGMIAAILMRALHKDISRYNIVGDESGEAEDYGWKLCHADVFRSPESPIALSVLIGNGVHLFLMISVTLVLAALGFLAPSNRGALGTATLTLYVCFASASGYVSARVYKMFQGEHWRRTVFFTAFAFPGSVFAVFFLLNFLLVASQSSAAVPFGTLFALMCMWFLVSAPLCALGAYFGFISPAWEPPCKTNQIPRQVPIQPFYLNEWVTAITGGILPFGATFIELYFMLNSIWMGRVYYVFGFLVIVFTILVITCSEVAILMCYFHLCTEDYRWTWRAFKTAGATGGYVFLYSIIYFVRKLQLNNLSSVALKIFGSIKVD
ncbi:hypothetical protein HK102_004150 [Quaeritorhiza haematococci]|nr:hypothetical protein HK102_004150 [Quaeritorhiza haematococci]